MKNAYKNTFNSFGWKDFWWNEKCHTYFVKICPILWLENGICVSEMVMPLWRNRFEEVWTIVIATVIIHSQLCTVLEYASHGHSKTVFWTRHIENVNGSEHMAAFNNCCPCGCFELWQASLEVSLTWMTSVKKDVMYVLWQQPTTYWYWHWHTGQWLC